MTIGTAIKTARTAAKWSQAKLAKKINASQPALSDWERGRSEPSRERVRAIERALLLKDGTLESLSKDASAFEAELDSFDRAATAVSIPELDIRASAGGGAINFSPETIIRRWPFSRETLTELRLPASGLAMIEITGDSMAPTLASGDRIIVDTGDKRLPGVFVISDGDALIAKRIERVPGPAGAKTRLRITSDNKLHNDHEVEAEWVELIGRVVALVRRL